MKLLLKDIPQSLDYERLERYVSAYAKTFALKALDPQQPDQSSWNATLSVPHKISSLMLIELLDKERSGSGTISIKILEESS
jgi:hypothetical protein